MPRRPKALLDRASMSKKLSELASQRPLDLQTGNLVCRKVSGELISSRYLKLEDLCFSPEHFRMSTDTPSTRKQTKRTQLVASEVNLYPQCILSIFFLWIPDVCIFIGFSFTRIFTYFMQTDYSSYRPVTRILLDVFVA